MSLGNMRALGVILIAPVGMLAGQTCRAFARWLDISCPMAPRQTRRVPDGQPRKNHLLLLHVWRELVRRDGAAAPKLVGIKAFLASL